MSSQTMVGMKVNIGADSSQFRKGMTEAEKGVKTFKKEAGGAFDSFAAAFGVNMGELRTSMNSFRSALTGLGKAATTSAAGAGFFTKALQVLKVAMISTGIGALIVALGSLVSYFTKTERGADTLAKVMAGFKAIFDVLLDRLSAFGEGVFFIFTGKFREGWESLKKSVRGIGQEMYNETKQAVSLESALDDLYDRETALKEVQAQRNLEVAKLRREAENQNLSEKKRAEMLQKAMDLEKQTLKENLEIQREKARIETEKVGMSESMAEDERRAAEERAKLAQMEADMINSTRRMYTKEQGLSAAAAKEVAEATQEQAQTYRELREAEQQLFDMQVELRKQMLAPIQQQKYTGLDTQTLGKMEPLSEEQKARLYADLDEMKGITMDFTGTINDAISDMAVGFAESIGKMIAGTGGIEDIGSMLAASFGDLLVNIGKIAIAAGTVSLGLSALFESGMLSPGAAMAAIGAGAAAVALGTALKAALSNAGKGGASASSMVSQPFTGFGTQTGTNAYKSAEPLRVQVIGETVIRNKDIYIAYKTAESNRKINT